MQISPTFLLLGLLNVYCATACVDPLEISKEWQIRLVPSLFLNQTSGSKAFLDYVNGLSTNITISTKKAATDTRLLILYDTANASLAKANCQLVFRSWLTSPDEPWVPPSEIKLKLRYSSYGAALSAPLQNSENWTTAGLIECKPKLEQDIHTSYYRYAFTSKMFGSSFVVFDGSKLTTLGQIGSIYPGFLAFLQRNDSATTAATELNQKVQYRWVMEDISMKFNGTKVKASLTLTYTSLEGVTTGNSLPNTVEFAWRQKKGKKNWNCAIWTGSRNLLSTLTSSDWSMNTTCCAVDKQGCDIGSLTTYGPTGNVPTPNPHGGSSTVNIVGHCIVVVLICAGMWNMYHL